MAGGPGRGPFGHFVGGVSTGLLAPVWRTHAGDGSGRLFVADQFGLLHEFDPATGARRTFLAVRNRLVPFDFFEDVPPLDRFLLGFGKDGGIYMMTNATIKRSAPG